MTPVRVTTRDEVGDMAASFNILQAEIGSAAVSLTEAREGLRRARDDLTDANARLEERVTQLNRAEEKLSGVLDSIDSVVWSISPAPYELLYLSPAAERVYGRPVPEFLADARLWPGAVHPDDRRRVRDWLDTLVADRSTTLEYRIVRPDGSERWLEDKARLIVGPGCSGIRIDGVASDISERRLHGERMAHQASHDALTGLPNRSLLNERIAQALALARRADQHVAVLYLDLDGFKFVNDSFGHAFGDDLLCSVAARLQALVRESDTVARLGGDEFVVLLPALSSAAGVGHVAAKVLAALAAPFSQGGRDQHVSASIGISVFPQDGDSGDSLLQHADVAMYRAKAKGRNTIQGYSREMGVQAQERMELEGALRVALERGQLELHYQPQVDRHGGRIVGVEALLRWHHPTLGMVPPADFIPLAEETGLIIPIGEWVLRTACAQASTWHAAGFTTLSMAVNMSARQFQQQDVPSLVRDVLAGSGLPAGCLELELTESTLMHNTDAAAQTMQEIKQLGVRLALDDFGTGYSSLSYLRRFPIDVLKIDRSFTFDVTSDEGAASITRAIIAMARSLNMTTVAEGVGNGRAPRVPERTRLRHDARLLHQPAAARRPHDGAARERPVDERQGGPCDRHGGELPAAGAGRVPARADAARAGPSSAASGLPVHAVVAVDLLAVVAAVERHLVLRIARRIFEAALVQRHDVAIVDGVVLQHAPWQRVAVRAHAEKAAEFKDRVADLARSLVDHQVVDRTELVSGLVVHRGTFDLVRGNHITGHGCVHQSLLTLKGKGNWNARLGGTTRCVCRASFFGRCAACGGQQVSSHWVGRTAIRHGSERRR